MSQKPRYVLQRSKDAKGRFKRMLGRRFVVRLHMALILGAVVGAGLGISKLLLWLGLSNMPGRYALVVMSGVLVFLGCIKLWLLYVQSSLITGTHANAGDVLEAVDVAVDVVEVADEIMSSGGLGDAPVPTDGEPVVGNFAEGVPDAAADGVGEAQVVIPSEGPGEAVASAEVDSGESASDAGEGVLGLLDGDGEGLILLVIVVALAVIFGAGVYVIWQAPIILAEAAFPALLAAALRRKGKEIDHPHWTGSVLKKVWVPVAIVLVVSVLSGLIIQGLCPEAVTAAEAVRRCVQ